MCYLTTKESLCFSKERENTEVKLIAVIISKLKNLNPNPNPNPNPNYKPLKPNSNQWIMLRGGPLFLRSTELSVWILFEKFRWKCHKAKRFIIIPRPGSNLQTEIQWLKFPKFVTYWRWVSVFCKGGKRCGSWTENYKL